MSVLARRLPQSQTIRIEAGLPARDHILLSIDHHEGIIESAKLEGVGCLELLKLFQEWRPKLTGGLESLPLPTGSGHAAILLREVILKAQGKWAFPYSAEELCHCRAVATARVDAAIVSGCHTMERIRATTSASTSCGTCRPDIEAILKYRLGK
jgi:bacterioferritin-associated ferredoxin